jgi:hypothetical protein
VPIGYRLSDGALVSGRAFGITIPLTDSFQVGVSSLYIGSGALTANNAFRLTYSFLPLWGASLYVGMSGPTPGRAWARTIPYGRAAPRDSGRPLRLRLDYIFDTTDVAGGSILFSTTFLFGM